VRFLSNITNAAMLLLCAAAGSTTTDAAKLNEKWLPRGSHVTIKGLLIKAQQPTKGCQGTTLASSITLCLQDWLHNDFSKWIAKPVVVHRGRPA
jgi:hypothetical protein